MSRGSATGDCNNNDNTGTRNGSYQRYGIEYVDNNRRPTQDFIHGIKLGFVGHVTRSRLLIGLLASVCLTFCSLLTRCMPVTTVGNGAEGCRTEVKVEVMGQLRRLAAVKEYDGHLIEKMLPADSSKTDSSHDSR
jgi:hypothetical protein